MPTEKKKILFVINPISGSNNKKKTDEILKEKATNAGYETAFFYTKGENDEKLLTEKIEKEEPNIVVAVGGDGTINMVGVTVLNLNVKLGIIALGSANGMARALEIPTDIDAAMDIITAGKSQKLDILKVNQHYVLHLSDVGLNARIVRKFEENKDTRGLYGYAKQSFRELTTLHSHKYKIEIDGKTILKKALMIVIANANKYGTGAIINPDGKLDDGFFELIIIKPYRSIGFLKIIKAFFTGNYKNIEFVDIHSVKKARIENFDQQTLQVDGEIAGKPNIIDVEILPQQIEIVAPWANRS